MLLKIAAAGAGAFAGNWVAEKFILKNAEGGGFVEVNPDTFGLDDAVKWVMIGLGAYAGMQLAAGKSPVTAITGG